MPFYFRKGDLVKTECDALVNASNARLIMLEGVGRAIYHAAGDKELTKACKEIGSCKVGHAVMTPSFNMTSCKAIIHAVGPNYINGKHGEEKNLISAYEESLRICEDNDFKVIAFPLLSSEFNYPLRECVDVCEKTILKFLENHEDYKIHVVIYKNFPETLSNDEKAKLSQYLMSTYVKLPEDKRKTPQKSTILLDFVKNLQSSKGISLEEFAKNANYTTSDLYNLLTLDGKDISFSELCSLAIGLKMDLVDFEKMLKLAGIDDYRTNPTTLTTSYFIINERFNFCEVNRALFTFDCGTTLGL